MRLTTYIFSLILFLTLIQCGGEDSLSKNVEMSVTPEKPIVQNTDVIIPIGSGDSVLTITGPFTSFGVTIGNKTGETLIVTGLRLETTYDMVDPTTGAIKTSTALADVSPASLASQELTIKSTESCTFAGGDCNQNALAILPSGTTDFQLRAFTSTGTPVILRLYFASLPENDGKNFVYRMKLSILGFFGTPTGITARVNKSIYFTTF